MSIIWKLCLTFWISGAILLVLFQMIFDKGDRYTSPLFLKKWQEYVFYCLVAIELTPIVIVAIILLITIFKVIWSA